MELPETSRVGLIIFAAVLGIVFCGFSVCLWRYWRLRERRRLEKEQATLLVSDLASRVHDRPSTDLLNLELGDEVLLEKGGSHGDPGKRAKNGKKNKKGAQQQRQVANVAKGRKYISNEASGDVHNIFDERMDNVRRSRVDILFDDEEDLLFKHKANEVKHEDLWYVSGKHLSTGEGLPSSPPAKASLAKMLLSQGGFGQVFKGRCTTQHVAKLTIFLLFLLRIRIL